MESFNLHRCMVFHKEMEPEVSNCCPGDTGKAMPLVWSWGLYLLFPHRISVYKVSKHSESDSHSSCLTLWDPLNWSFCPWNSPSKNTGVGSHSLLQGIFPTQGSNPVSHTAGKFFTVWVAREARTVKPSTMQRPASETVNQKDLQPSPCAKNTLLRLPWVQLKRPRIGSTKHHAEARTELYFTAMQPALIKDSLQTGASHWADFWNGFLFIPRDTSRAEGGFMQYRSVSHWQHLTLWQAAWLGWKSRLGLGPVKATLLNYWQAFTVVQGESEP